MQYVSGTTCMYPNKVTLGKVDQTPTWSWKTPIPTSLLTTIVGQLRFAEEDMVQLSDALSDALSLLTLYPSNFRPDSHQTCNI